MQKYVFLMLPMPLVIESYYYVPPYPADEFSYAQYADIQALPAAT